MKCIVCKENILEIHHSGHIFHSGIVKDVIPNYGSSHDLRKIKIGICDKCLSKAEEEKTIEIIKENVDPYEYE